MQWLGRDGEAGCSPGSRAPRTASTGAGAPARARPSGREAELLPPTTPTAAWAAHDAAVDGAPTTARCCASGVHPVAARRPARRARRDAGLRTVTAVAAAPGSPRSSVPATPDAVDAVHRAGRRGRRHVDRCATAPPGASTCPRSGPAPASAALLRAVAAVARPRPAPRPRAARALAAPSPTGVSRMTQTAPATRPARRPTSPPSAARRPRPERADRPAAAPDVLGARHLRRPPPAGAGAARRLRALRLLPADLPHLRALGRGDGLPARAHLPHGDGGEGRDPARGRLHHAHRPLPGLHGVRDRVPVGRAVRPAARGHPAADRAQRAAHAGRPAVPRGDLHAVPLPAAAAGGLARRARSTRSCARRAWTACWPGVPRRLERLVAMESLLPPVSRARRVRPHPRAHPGRRAPPWPRRAAHRLRAGRLLPPRQPRHRARARRRGLRRRRPARAGAAAGRSGCTPGARRSRSSARRR